MTEENTTETANGQPKRLTIDDILSTPDLPEKDVYVELWGGTIRLKALSRAVVKKAYRDGTDRAGNVDADLVEQMLVTWASVDPKINPETFRRLQEKNAGAIAQIIDAVLGLSGIDKAALERARESFRD